MWKFLPTGLKHTHLSSCLTARTQQCHNYTLSGKSKFLNVGKSTSVKNTTSRKPSLFVPCKRKPEPWRVQLLRAGGIATQHRVDPFFLYPLTTHPYSIFSITTKALLASMVLDTVCKQSLTINHTTFRKNLLITNLD